MVGFCCFMSRSFFMKLGLLVALLIITAVLSGCQGDPANAAGIVTNTPTRILPTVTSSPTNPVLSPTPTATKIPPTATLLPSLTHTAAPTGTPTPTARGALTWEQEARLYEASLRFLADNEKDATIVVRDQIDYLESIAEDPSLACGPISAVILRDAGLLPPDTDLHGFWLLDPRSRTSQIVLETYFPADHYEWYQFDTPTNEFDFKAFPLLPGDFLYLYAGTNATFEHIITVNRVDETGRAYTVSNLATEEGFVIRELMLYDPNDPGVGQFYDWMDREINGRLGMTGHGGFDLWRPLAPVQDYAQP